MHLTGPRNDLFLQHNFFGCFLERQTSTSIIEDHSDTDAQGKISNWQNEENETCSSEIFFLDPLQDNPLKCEEKKKSRPSLRLLVKKTRTGGFRRFKSENETEDGSDKICPVLSPIPYSPSPQSNKANPNEINLG